MSIKTERVLSSPSLANCLINPHRRYKNLRPIDMTSTWPSTKSSKPRQRVRTPAHSSSKDGATTADSKEAAS